MRLWIVEKYSLGNYLRKANLIQPDDHVLYTIGFGHWRFSLPDIPFSDIPYTLNPEKTEPLFNHTHGCYLEQGDRSSMIMESKNSPKTKEYKTLVLEHLINTVRTHLTEYTEIIVCVDNDRSGMWGAGQVIEQLPHDKTPDIFALNNRSYDIESLKKAYECRFGQPWREGVSCKTLQDQQRIKKYFDHWWYANGRLVFGELSNKTGLAQGRLLSKFAVMLLVIMSQSSKRFTEAGLVRLMQDWRGTGKYKDKRVSIGSNASRAAIIQNLYDCDALCKDTKNVMLTTNGRDFVEGLHPRTYDPDLPFRLDQWCKEGDIESVKRYINTLFGRQLRYQRHRT